MASKLLIVDDEPLARARLRAQLAELAADAVIGEASTGLQALELVQAWHPDIVLLDIRMPGMDGLETARHLLRLPHPPAIIFTTAFNEHALAAFETQAIDYLLKPVRLERLQSALTRARLFTSAQLRELAGDRAEPVARTHFSALSKGSLRLVHVQDVRYLQADQGYVTVNFATGELLIQESLRALEEEFREAFVRIHRNTLVAVAYVLGLERDGVGNCSVQLDGLVEKLPISRRLLSDVRRRLRANAAGAD